MHQEQSKHDFDLLSIRPAANVGTCRAEPTFMSLILIVLIVLLLLGGGGGYYYGGPRLGGGIGGLLLVILILYLVFGSRA
jgi:uncharacterized membrane protein YccC